jgi:hypothetical protein
MDNFQIIIKSISNLILYNNNDNYNDDHHSNNNNNNINNNKNNNNNNKNSNNNSMLTFKFNVKLLIIFRRRNKEIDEGILCKMCQYKASVIISKLYQFRFTRVLSISQPKFY